MSPKAGEMDEKKKRQTNGRVHLNAANYVNGSKKRIGY